MKIFTIIMMSIILMGVLISVGCIDSNLPHSGKFTITQRESNDGTYWVYPSTYLYTQHVKDETGKTTTVYSTQYFVNRHNIGDTFDGATQVLRDYNDHNILIFASDTPDAFRNEHPELQSPDGCPAWGDNSLLKVVYAENYYDIPGTGAHYWEYIDPDGTSKSYLTLNQLMNHINQSEGKYRTDCIYISTHTHDYWENDVGPYWGDAATKLTTVYPKMVSLQVNFATNASEIAAAHKKDIVSTIQPPSTSSNDGYGCPGCPDNFMSFAKDMCSRGLGMETVTDGTNTLECSEINKEDNKE